MQGKGKRVLIVDDDHDFRRATRKILESGGYEVVEAPTGGEGFEKAAAELPELVLIDIIMETYSEGFKLISKLAGDDRTKDIPRIILSSLGIQQNLDMVYPEDLGTMYILQKPVKKEDLLAKVESVFAAEQ